MRRPVQAPYNGRMSSSADNALPSIQCPQCGGPSSFERSNRFRPFCSERCKLIDLGAWGNEDFRVPAQSPPLDQPYGDPRLED